MMQTTDQIIDEILLSSPYGAKAYEARQNRQRKDNSQVEEKEDEIVDHHGQTYINFKEESND